jgi:DEAD/DEAH box helicase domain-containing protein
VVKALAQRGIAQPYTHQAEAIEAVLRGENVVVVAGTAGGKSLCYQVPILNDLLNNPNARALCLFPTKALAQDQLSAFSNHLLAMSDQRLIANRSSPIATYDGDTPQAKRGEIRKEARVLISNADMLHIGILPHHPRWTNFFRNLKYVVIDELHTYRGIFGSHVANVIRRLKRLCAFYGAQPTFMLASATIANPQEHAERLIESPVTLINNDGSPKGERNMVLVNPPLLDAALGIRQSAQFVARDLAAKLIREGAQTICFARSRQAAEILLTYLRNASRDWRLEVGASNQSPISNLQSRISPISPISGYRGGYLPEERRAIEKGLREGSVRGVVATNALELGIDIGELDACVMLGYPGTIASFWQQAGRAGRRLKPSLAVMVNTANALDQYLAQHPDYLFKQTPEHARIAPDNLGVLAAHVACATFEMPFTTGATLGNAHIEELLSALAEQGEVYVSGGIGAPLAREGGQSPTTNPQSPTPARYTWVGDNYPADRTGLRGVGDRIVIECEGQIIGETERATAAVRVHVGAVYLHQGQTYLIRELNWETGKADAWKVESEYYTQASATSEVVVVREFESRTVRQGDSASVSTVPLPYCPTATLGEIEVTTRVGRFKQVQFDSHRVVGWGDVDVPAQRLLTVGYWFAIPEELAKALERQGIIALPNDYGPNWQKQRKAARERDGYKCSVCGRPEPPEREHDVHHKKPFRTFGYRRGENENYLQANELENLMTVCPECHMRIETAQPVNGALSSLCYLLGNLAPLFVMCDPSDLAAIFEIESPHTRLPTITVHEMTPGGTGLCEELMLHHTALLHMAAQRLRECDCERGCPACAGPISDEQTRDVKRDTLTLVEELLK